MIRCERCGRVIQAYEVKYRLEVDGRRRTFCNEDAKELLKGSEPKAPAKPAAAPKAAPSPAAPAPAAKPALSPDELEARKRAALEKAAALKAAKPQEPQQG